MGCACPHGGLFVCSWHGRLLSMRFMEPIVKAVALVLTFFWWEKCAPNLDTRVNSKLLEYLRFYGWRDPWNWIARAFLHTFQHRTVAFQASNSLPSVLRWLLRRGWNKDVLKRWSNMFRPLCHSFGIDLFSGQVLCWWYPYRLLVDFGDLNLVFFGRGPIYHDGWRQPGPVGRMQLPGTINSAWTEPGASNTTLENTQVPRVELNPFLRWLQNYSTARPWSGCKWFRCH